MATIASMPFASLGHSSDRKFSASASRFVGPTGFGGGFWIKAPNLTIGRSLDALWVPPVPQELSKLYYEMRDGYRTADATVSLQKVATQLGYEDLSTVPAQDMAVEALKEIEKLTRVKKMMEEAARPF